jgi:GAF domain-containing protein
VVLSLEEAMRRRSTPSGQPAKSRRRKAAALKRRDPRRAKQATSRSASSAETKITQLTRERDEALEQQRAAAEVLKIISASKTELRPVLEVVVKSAARYCKADDVTLFELDGQDLREAAHWGAAPHLEGLRFPCTRGSVAGRIVLERKPVHVFDLQAEAEDFPEGSAMARRFGHRTIAGVPLLREGVAVGTLQLRRTEVNPFTDKQIALLGIFAAQAVIAIENARLLSELRQRTDDLGDALEQQTATSEVLKVISNSLSDTQPVFETIVRSGVTLFSEAAVSIALVDNDMVRAAAVADRDPARAEAWRRIFPFPLTREYMHSKVILERKMLDIPDAEHAPADLAVGAKNFLRSGYRAVTIVPLMRGDQAIGALSVVRVPPGPLSDKQLATLKTYADQAIIAIENTRLLNELRQSLEQQTATSEVLRVISSSPTNVQPVFDSIAESAVKLSGGQFSFVLRFDGKVMDFASCSGLSGEGLEVFHRMFPQPPSEGIAAGRAILRRDLVEIPDVAADHAYDAQNQNFAQMIAYRSIMAVPLLHEGNPIGTIAVARANTGAFPERQIALLRAFADQAVIAIRNVRLFDEVQARTGELSQSVEELRALGEVSQAINSTLDVETVLTTIVVKAVQLSGTEAGTIYTFDESRQEFRLRATDGMDEVMIAAIRDRGSHIGETMIGKAVAERTPIQIADTHKDPSLVLDIIMQAGFRALLTVPLLRSDQIIGALVVRRKEPGEFPEHTIKLLQTFADQSVLTIQNARLFREIEDKSRQLEEASQHKSQFLANMSHELRTPLNAILGYTELMTDGAYGEPSEKMLGILKRLEANGKHLLGLINDVLDLSKIEAGQLALELSEYCIQDIAQTVRSTLEPLAADKKLGFKVEMSSELPPGHGDGRRLTQVLINLVGNAIKFTDAGEVAIKAEANNGSFHVSVRDTGPGISAADRVKLFQEFQQANNAITRKKGGTGLGLAISKRIIEMHGGRIWVGRKSAKAPPLRSPYRLSLSNKST